MKDKFAKGAEWRKWDLHFHTPTSYDYENKSITDKEIVETLKEKEISAVAITDHNTIDVARIKSLKEESKDLITIFPGIEFCSELGGSESIHFIGIFPENCDIDSIWKTIEVRCKLTPLDIKQRGGICNIQTDLTDACDLIHELDGITTIHAGKKSNSVENIKNNLVAKMQQKQRILSNYIDIMEIGSVADVERYKHVVFSTIGFSVPLIICSDNHNTQNYIIKDNCWIKADPTFEGLKQVLNEPEGRVFIGEEPDVFIRERNNSTKFLEKIEITSVDGYAKEIAGEWFSNISIDLNSELVAIIGNKGSGKSAISDILALCGKHKQNICGNFSFLNTDKFRSDKNRIARNFKAKLFFKSGDTEDALLSEDPKDENEALVKYIPQHYFENLCNELNTGINLEKEIESVIYQYIEIEKRVQTKNFKELKKYKTENSVKNINSIKIELSDINSKIISLQEKLQESYKLEITNQLELKRKELNAIKYPEEKKNPDEDIQSKVENAEIIKQIGEILQKKDSLTKELGLKNSRLIFLTKEYEDVKSFRTFLTNLKNNFEEDILKKINANECLLQFKEGLYSFKINFDKINSFILDCEKELKDLRIQLDNSIGDKEKNSIYAKIKSCEDEFREKTEKLSSKQKEYQAYLVAIKGIDSLKNKIIGDELSINSIKYLEKELNKIVNEYPILLSQKFGERNACIKRIFDQKLEMLSIYSDVKQKIDEKISRNANILNEYNIEITAEFVISNDFKNNFLNYIHKGRAGSFCGTEEARNKVDEIVDSVNIEKYEDVISIINEIEYNLNNNTKDSSNIVKNDILKQIDKSKLLDFYNFITSIEYIEPIYELKSYRKNLKNLSPGEKGALLLVFYLLLDNDDKPLIIDQPEDNLDNESIARILVSFIREAKAKRQIIMVTHNPNLAVVADAEQVIYVNIDKMNGNKFSFESGSIENPKINKHIVDVLEGAMPAFTKRKDKYLDK